MPPGADRRLRATPRTRAVAGVTLAASAVLAVLSLPATARAFAPAATTPAAAPSAEPAPPPPSLNVPPPRRGAPPAPKADPVPVEGDGAPPSSEAAPPAAPPATELPAPLPEPAPVRAPPAPAAVPQEPAEAPGPVLQRRRLVPPFWMSWTYDTHTTRTMLVPPLFFDRRPRDRGATRPRLVHFDLSLTIGWQKKGSDRRRFLNPAALFFGSWSARKTSWGTAALLMGYRRMGEQFNFGQFPLVWAWGNRNVRNLVVGPLHYHQKVPEGLRGVSALLFWYGHKHLKTPDPQDDRRWFGVAPVYLHYQKGLRRFDVSPLYAGGGNELKGIKHATLFPFFHWQSREFGNARDLWTPLWVARHDDARRRHAWAFPPALVFQARSPRRTISGFTPLVWRARDHTTLATTQVVGPVVRHVDPRQANTVVFPLVWRFSDRTTKTTTTLFLPLGAARSEPGRRRVWTLLGGGMRGRDGAYAFGVPPLLTFGRRDPERGSFAGILGLAWWARAADRTSSRLVLGPLAFSARDPDGWRFAIPAALTLAQRQGTRSFQVVGGLYWHARETDPARASSTHAVPPFYLHRTRDGFHAGLAPLVFFGSDARRRYGVAPLLLTGWGEDRREGRAFFLSPVAAAVRTKDASTLGVLGAFWDVKRGPKDRTTVLFPFWARRQRGDEVLHITPLGGGRSSPAGRGFMIGPVYWRRRGTDRAWGILPLAFHDSRTVDGKPVRTTAVVPFYLRREDPSGHWSAITPLVWRTRVEGLRPREGLAVAPFYFRQRQPGGVDVDAGLGFFWSRDRRRHTHTLVAGPYFHRLSRKALYSGVAPFALWEDSEERRRFYSIFGTFHFQDKREGGHTTIAPPLWFDRQRPNGRRIWAAVPFMAGGRRLYNFTRFGIAAPGFVDFFRIGKNHRFTGWVPFLFRYQKCGFQEDDASSCRYTVWGSAPLFLYGRDGQGRRTHGLLGLYYADRRPGGFRLLTLPFGVTWKKDESLSWYVATLGVKTTRTHRRTMFLPFFWRKAHRTEDTSTTVVPPIFVSRRRQDRRFLSAGLVFWQARQQHKVTTTILPPVFLHAHAWQQRRLTWLLPLFVRDDHKAKDSTFTMVPPLAYVQRRKGKDLDFVQFPLVWHIERGENEGTFGAFLWWDIRVKKTAVQLVPGVFTRVRKREGGITTVLGPGLAWWRKDGDDRHVRVLFGAFGGGVENGRRYATVFGAHIDRGPVSPAAKRTTKRQRRKMVTRTSGSSSVGRSS